MPDYRSLFTRSREASCSRHVITYTTMDHYHFHFNSIEISCNNVRLHIRVLPFQSLITHCWLHYGEATARSCHLPSWLYVRFTLARSLNPLSLNTSTAVAWLPRSRSLLGLFTIHLATVYRRRTLRNATINNHTDRQTHRQTHTHTHTHSGSMFPLTVGPVSAVSCSIEIVKKNHPSSSYSKQGRRYKMEGCKDFPRGAGTCPRIRSLFIHPPFRLLL